MAHFENSFTEDGGGWGGETSFATEGPNEREAKSIADKLPIPVDIGTLSSLVDENLPLGSMKFTSVITIGDVVEMNDENQGKQYVIALPEDHSTTFTVVSYDSEDTGMDFAVSTQIQLNSRIYVSGKLRSFDGKVVMMSFKMRVVENPLEYEAFKKECEVARLFFEKDVPALLRQGGDAVKQLAGSACGTLDSAPSTANPSAPNTTRAPEAAVSAAAPPKASSTPTKKVLAGSLAEKILDALREASLAYRGGEDRKDLSVSGLLTRLGMPSGQESTLRKALNDLSNEGHIYNSIDDDHYEII